MNDQVTKAKKIIADNIYMTISTSSLGGEPWVSPVFFVYDEKYSLFWTSNKNSRHSKLLRDNPQAAIVIFDSAAPEGDGDGVYFEARIRELTSLEEVNKGIELWNKRVTKDEFKIKNISEVIGHGAWRVYCAVPYKISTLASGEYIDGQYVDKREEITL